MAESTVSVTIDGREIQVARDVTALEAARELGIHIPTLCYHPALTPYGACRLCVVEVKRGKRSRLVTSCTYPIREDGLVIDTHSERVLRDRRMIVELLLARCPNVKIIQDLADELGVERPRFSLKEEDCILCGLCVRVCEEVIGASAISFVGRGPDRKVMTPFQEASDVCLGCGACADVCPTGAIKLEDVLDKRNMVNWHTALERRRCRMCGNYFAPEVELKYLEGKADLLQEMMEVCPQCRRKLAGTQWVTGVRALPAIERG